MKVFIDTNPRWSGGYLAHLKGILTSGLIPDDFKITLYGTQKLLDAVGPLAPEIEWIVDDSLPLNPVKMNRWRRENLPKLLLAHAPDVHFSLAGSITSRRIEGIKTVTMSRNLQPHLVEERRRLPLLSFGRLRLEVLHRKLKSSFARADGVIFLTDYVREVIVKERVKLKLSAVIPHGLSDAFRREPVRKPLPAQPVILYVSPFNIYKFQWQVARGVDLARRQTGLDLQLHLVGGTGSDGWGLFEQARTELGNPSWLKVIAHIPYGEIPRVYQSADVFVFASTVETIGNILLEAMASGLPIACSNRRPMTDILGGDGVTFESDDPASIATGIIRLLQDDDLRFKSATSAYQRSLAYSWQRTARETFEFLKEVSV